jgi:hypothetical protein
MLEKFKLAQTEKDQHLRKYGPATPRAENACIRLAQRSIQAGSPHIVASSESRRNPARPKIDAGALPLAITALAVLAVVMSKGSMDYRKKFFVDADERLRLRKLDPSYRGDHESEETAKQETEHFRVKLAHQQALLYATSVSTRCWSCCRPWTPVARTAL